MRIDEERKRTDILLQEERKRGKEQNNHRREELREVRGLLMDLLLKRSIEKPIKQVKSLIIEHYH